MSTRSTDGSSLEKPATPKKLPMSPLTNYSWTNIKSTQIVNGIEVEVADLTAEIPLQPVTTGVKRARIQGDSDDEVTIISHRKKTPRSLSADPTHRSSSADDSDTDREVDLDFSLDIRNLIDHIPLDDNAPTGWRSKQQRQREGRRLVKKKDVEPSQRLGYLSDDEEDEKKDIDNVFNDGTGIEEEIEKDRESIVTAAKRMGLKRKLVIVSRKEEVINHGHDEAEVHIKDSDKAYSPAQTQEVVQNGKNIGAEDDVQWIQGDQIGAKDGTHARQFMDITEEKIMWRVPDMITPLMDHQVLGVDWMLQHEFSEKAPRGGLVADAMGLGKTIQSIAAMCLNYPEQPPEDDIHYKPDDYPQVTLIVAPMSLLEQWKQEIKTHCKKRTFSVFIHHGKDRVKTARQLRDQDVVLCTYQAIMRSYPSKPKGRKKMTKEEYEDWFDQAWENRGIFHRVKFWRVIMDEAHIIKNHNGRISMACQALDAVHTWALTGTPIQNSVDDVFPILKFIKHPTAIDIETYRKVVGRKDSKVKAQRVQVLVRKYMMRRTKRDYLMGRPLISLPRKRITMAELELGVEERALYMAVEAHAREKINRYIRTGTTMQNFSSMLVMLLRLRQICCHPFLILQAISREFTIDDLNIALQTNIDDDDPDFHDLVMGTPDTSQEASGSDFTKKQQRSVLRGVLEAAKNMPLGDQDKCAICLDPKEDPVMTKCRHAFCRDCIQGVIENCMERNQLPTPCPLCKKPIESEEELRSLREVEIEAGRDADDGKCWTDQGLEFTHSAKTIALRDQLAEWRQTNPDDKIVIFSQFTKMIEIAEHVVAQEDWDYTVFRGVMDMQERQDALDTFRHNSQCKIMLISIKAGGVGLNLTQANLVLSLDLWWNAATELQAFDRVHRLGQRKQVFITRVVVKNTVETRMLELQDRKLAMAKAALGEGEANLGKLSVRDLMGLFGRLEERNGGLVLEADYDRDEAMRRARQVLRNRQRDT